MVLKDVSFLPHTNELVWVLVTRKGVSDLLCLLPGSFKFLCQEPKPLVSFLEEQLQKQIPCLPHGNMQ